MNVSSLRLGTVEAASDADIGLFVGRREDGDFAGTVRFFADVLRLTVEKRDDIGEFAEFRLPSGQGFGVIGPKSKWHRFHHCAVVGFDVRDIVSARRELEAKGIKFLSETEQRGGEAWAYFRGPDGHIYEIWTKTDAMKLVSAGR